MNDSVGIVPFRPSHMIGYLLGKRRGVLPACYALLTGSCWHCKRDQLTHARKLRRQIGPDLLCRGLGYADGERYIASTPEFILVYLETSTLRTSAIVGAPGSGTYTPFLNQLCLNSGLQVEHCTGQKRN